jgi:hypothetical protein
MPRTTNTTRRSRSGGKFPPQYARALEIDDMPHGGARSGSGLQAWQLPLPKRLVGVIVCGQIKMRWCAVVGQEPPVARARAAMAMV